MAGALWRFRALALLAAAAMAGCRQAAPPVEIVHVRPARVELPRDVRRLAVGEIRGQTEEEMFWARSAEEGLERRMAQAARDEGRYEILRRPRGGDSADAVVDGRMAIRKTSSHVRAAAAGRRRFACDVSAQFVIDRPGGETLAAIRVSRSYDSDLQAEPAAPGDERERQAILAGLVDECVDGLVANLFSATTVVRETLARSKSAGVADGNKLAAAGRHEQALASF